MDGPPGILTARLITRALALATALLALLLAACGSVSEEAPSPSPPESGGYLGNLLTSPLPKPDFTLTDTSGEPFAFAAETEGYVALLYFGYTHCPDVCPDHMANIAAVLRRAPALPDKVKVVFVTVDPARDTPERLRQWLDLFDPSFVGLTGSADAVDAAMRQTLGDLYFPITREDLGDGEYSVSHAAFVLAYTADNLAHIVYPFGVQQDAWEHDLLRLVNEKWTEPPAAAVEPTATVPPASAAGATTWSAAERPRRLKPDEAKKLLGAEFSETTIEAVREAINTAFDHHPEAARFMSQGLIVPREQLDLELRICGSRPEGKPDTSLLACSTLGGCARLTRVLYEYYVQSGYEEFYQAALSVFNYVSTSLPDEAEAFFYLVRSELRVSGLPAG